MAVTEADRQIIFNKLFATSRWSYDNLYPVEQHYFFDNLWEQHQSSTASEPPHKTQTSSAHWQAGNSSVRKGVTHMHVTVRTQTVPLPDVAAKLCPLDSQAKVHTTSPKDYQTLSQQDYSPFCSKPNDLQSNSESEYAFDEATMAQPLMLKTTNVQDKSHDTPPQDNRHQIAIVSQLASLKSNIYALNTKLYASANGIVSTTTSIP